MSNSIATVSVVGAGTMGHGIAEVCALAGYDVVLRDVEDALVEGVRAFREDREPEFTGELSRPMTELDETETDEARGA